MYKRSAIRNKSQDRKVFSRSADRVHPKNLQGNPMRGGIRL